MTDPDQVVPLDIGCQPDVAVSGGVLVQTEYSTFLTFNAMSDSDEAPRDIGTALVEFQRCEITKFGYPNDEARPGDPRLREHVYGVYEVINSSWIRELTQTNRYMFPNTPDATESRHFVFLFHDTTFECVARGLKVEIVPGPYSAVFDRIRKRVVTE